MNEKILLNIKRYIDSKGKDFQSSKDLYDEGPGALGAGKFSFFSGITAGAATGAAGALTGAVLSGFGVSGDGGKNKFEGKQKNIFDKVKNALGQKKESFTDALLRLIREKGMTNADVYKNVNMDRREFSRILNGGKCTKTKTICLALGLRLSLEETAEFLDIAGFSLSQNDAFDLTVGYCIRDGLFDVMQINELLYALDLSLLG